MADTTLLEQKLQDIVASAGGGDDLRPPYDCPDKLGWYLELIGELLRAGGGGSGGGGVTTHRLLSGRDAADQHPISAITGLQSALTALDQAIQQHKSSTSDHNDMRTAISNLQSAVNGLNIPSLAPYRTASAQDTIDNEIKQSLVGIKTTAETALQPEALNEVKAHINDTNAHKDTVYDDTSLSLVISTHAANSSIHHAPYNDTEIKQQLNTHTADLNIHHAPYDDTEIKQSINTHTADTNIHHGPYDDSDIQATLASLQEQLSSGEISEPGLIQLQEALTALQLQLAALVQNDTIYDDTEIREQLDTAQTAIGTAQLALTTHINDLNAHKDTVYDDTALRQSISDIESYIQNIVDSITTSVGSVSTNLTNHINDANAHKDTVYDDSALQTRITNHINDANAHKDTLYDDSALQQQITTHINDANAHKDTVYDDSGLRSYVDEKIAGVNTGGGSGGASGIDSINIRYASSTLGTDAPTTGWQSIIPSVAAGSYLWTEITVNYGNGNTPAVFYTVARQGANGTSGTTPTIAAAAGANIGAVGTPAVSAATSGTTTTFTFNYLKGEKGNGIWKAPTATTTTSVLYSTNGWRAGDKFLVGSANVSLAGTTYNAYCIYEITAISTSAMTATLICNIQGPVDQNTISRVETLENQLISNAMEMAGKIKQLTFTYRSQTFKLPVLWNTEWSQIASSNAIEATISRSIQAFKYPQGTSYYGINLIPTTPTLDGYAVTTILVAAQATNALYYYKGTGQSAALQTMTAGGFSNASLSTITPPSGYVP